MKELQIFSSEEFGEIRTVVINSEPWFVGKEIADKLGYQNGSRDVNRHVDEEDRRRDKIIELREEAEKREKELTQKVYFELTGTHEEIEELKSISSRKKNFDGQLDEIQKQIIEKQKIYNTEAEKRMLGSGVVDEITLSKRMTPKTVDQLEDHLHYLHDKYGIMPKGIVYDPQKVSNATATYNWIDDKIYLGNKFNDADAYLDTIKKSEESHADYRKKTRRFTEKKMKEVEEVLSKDAVSDYEREKARVSKAEAEISLNPTRYGVRENLMDSLTHEYGHFIHRHANVDYIQKKNVFGAKDLGGKMIGGDWKYDLNTHKSANMKVMASKISEYAAETPYEAFAEGFVAIEKGEKIPGSIEGIIKNAMRNAGVKDIVTSLDSDIMTVVEEIHRSVGAKTRNYDVFNPATGEIVHLAEGTRIVQPKNHIMAGKGRERQIDCIDWLMDKYPEGEQGEWTKEKGFGYVLDEFGEERKVELHWYQNPKTGKVEMKIKAQYGGELYIDD